MNERYSNGLDLVPLAGTRKSSFGWVERDDHELYRCLDGWGWAFHGYRS